MPSRLGCVSGGTGKDDSWDSKFMSHPYRICSMGTVFLVLAFNCFFLHPHSVHLPPPNVPLAPHPSCSLQQCTAWHLLCCAAVGQCAALQRLCPTQCSGVLPCNRNVQRCAALRPLCDVAVERCVALQPFCRCAVTGRTKRVQHDTWPQSYKMHGTRTSGCSQHPLGDIDRKMPAIACEIVAAFFLTARHTKHCTT